MKVLGIIPARGGSKGIPNKNIKILNGKPLICYTIEAAKGSILTRVIVSTDCEKIAEVSKISGAEVLIRPANLAQDETPTLPVIQDVLNRLSEEYDAVMVLQPTSPIRNQLHINEAVNLFIKKRTDSLVSVVEVPHNFNPESIYSLNNDLLTNFMTTTNNKIFNRHEKKTYYARNGPAIIITKTDIIQKNNSFYAETITPYKMSAEHSFDIDDPVDFRITEALLKN
jgi:CMP-N-acetylneuraminic acid synthetase